ncbi:HAMP domain-containing histidine kinase [bacterium]|nr:HAMP domain-containing histidine kinase [bacterium]
MKLHVIPQLQKTCVSDTDKIHVLSHELRTPLAVISGYAQVLREELSSQHATLLTPILENVNRLDQVISTLLEWETVMPTSEAIASDCDICTIVDRVISRYAPLSSAKGIHIEVSSQGDNSSMHASVEAIESSLSQIVQNAIKFSEQGTIKVSLSCSSTHVLITVEDEGQGLPQNESELFEPFVQGSKGLNRSFDGLGLGLTLARTHLHRIGGTISLENSPRSEKGSGAKASISFPRFAKDSNKAGNKRLAA